MRDSATKYLCVSRLAAHAALAVSFSVGFPATGSAHLNGQTMASGKDSGFYCRNCHAAGTRPTPTVDFRGPTTMDPGSTATFSFTVSSHSASLIAAGFNVAASDGALGLVAGQETRLEFGEVTHSNPKANDANGQAIFEFTWQAPASTGTYTLFGAGCSVDGTGGRDLDAAARTTFEIGVGVATPTPTNSPPPPTPTLTPTSTPTHTARATRIPTPGEACVGDCGSDEEVTVDELIIGVNMALGATSRSACPVFDTNEDEEVTINEIVRAVNNARYGCPM